MVAAIAAVPFTHVLYLLGQLAQLDAAIASLSR